MRTELTSADARLAPRTTRSWVVGELLPTLHAEWGKTWSVRVPALWLLLAVGIAVVTAMTLANDFVHSISTGDLPADARMDTIEALGPAVSFAQIAVAAFALHLVTPEYASGSIAPTLMAQPRRWIVVASKAIIAGGVAALLGLVLGPVTAGTVDLILDDHHGAGMSVGEAASGITGVFGAAALIAVGLGFLTRSAVGALATAFLLLVVTLAAPGTASYYLPGLAGATFVSGDSADYPPVVGLVILLGWASAALGAAVWTVDRRDA